MTLDEISVFDGAPFPKPKTDKPKTNADRIRQMTDEELAEWLDTVIGSCSLNDCKYCPMYGACTDVPISMLRWLRKEAEEDAGTE